MTTTQTTSQLHNSGLTIENAPLFYRAVWAYIDLADAMGDRSATTKAERERLTRASASAVEYYAAIAQEDVSVALMQVIAVANPGNYGG